MRLRSGGCAECEAETVHPCEVRLPPTCATCVRCVHVRLDRRWRDGCRLGVHMKVVNFWSSAPSAHCMNVGDRRHSPDGPVSRVEEEGRGNVTSVRGMLEQVFGSRVARSSQQGHRAVDEGVGLRQLALVLRGHVGKARDMLAVSHGRWPAVGHVSCEEPAHRERGARGRGNDGGVLARRATLQEMRVDQV
eukprot:6212832-Pleurochrysis_carterae.AAC.4